MTQALNELFQQILNSEQIAEKRKQRCKETKAQIERVQREIQGSEEERAVLQSQLEQKIKCLNVETTETFFSRKRLDILHAQREELRKTVQANRNSYASLCEEVTLMESEVRSSVEQFLEQYGRKSDYMAQFRYHTLGTLATLDQEKLSLEKELSCWEERNRTMCQLRTEMQGLIVELQEWRDTNKQVEDMLEKERGKERLTYEEKEKLSTAPKTDPEFVKLQEKLSSANEEALDQECRRLQSELQGLQHRAWQQTTRYRFHRKSWQPRPVGPFTEEPIPKDVATTNKVCISNFENTTLARGTGQTSVNVEELVNVGIEEDFDDIAAVFDDSNDDLELSDDQCDLPTLKRTDRKKRKRSGENEQNHQQ